MPGASANRDRRFGSDNGIWVGIYDKKCKKKRLHIELSCWGGMGKYDFDNFYEDVTEKRDLETQEELLKILNLLLDEGILCFPKKGEENDI